ncbi:hypothetical protein [Methanosarcina sp.]|uniref:hypothetical protein n=1 Tax=Methanosarcina sp. TaxID=2213 RepID=UPI003BB6E24B
MNKHLKASLFLIFMCWSLSAVSGCIGSNESEYSSVSSEEIDVKPFSEEYQSTEKAGVLTQYILTG